MHEQKSLTWEATLSFAIPQQYALDFGRCIFLGTCNLRWLVRLVESALFLQTSRCGTMYQIDRKKASCGGNE